MRKRLITAVVAVWTGLCALHAANTVTVADAQGPAGGRADVTVSLSTDAADVVAAEIRVPLPEGAVPVAGSCRPDTGRLPRHSVTADINGNEYVIVVFNTSLQPIAAGGGEIVRFTIDLGGDPGQFDLTPTVKLSGADGSAIQSATEGGTLTVLGSRMELGETTADFYRVALHSTVTRTVTVTNTGTAPLTLTGFSTTVEGLGAVMPGPIAAGSRGELTLTYTPTQRCDAVNGHIYIESDDAVRDRQPILVRAVAYPVNELTIGDVSGSIDEEVTVTVAMDNMDPIVGAEFTLTLPKGIEFVEGSMEKAPRAASMSVDCSVTDNTATDYPDFDPDFDPDLYPDFYPDFDPDFYPDFGSKRLHVVMFSLGNSSIAGNSGDIVSFRLRLGGRASGRFKPENVILANAAGENTASGSRGGFLEVLTPSIQCDRWFAMGHVPVNGSRTMDYWVNNYGSAPLTLERVVFTDSRLRCDAAMPLTIAPGKYTSIPVTVADTSLGKFESTMNIYSNDPDNRLTTVMVTGNLYSPNELMLKGRYTDGNFLLEAGLDNDAGIVAMQLDVVCPPGITTDESMLTLAERAAGHSVTMAEVDTRRYRIILFSLSNKEFDGNHGTLFTLGFNGSDMTGKYVTVEGIKLSSADGRNFTTPDTEVKTEQVPVTVESVTVTLDAETLRAGETTWAYAIVEPWDATDRSVTWTSSDESVATVTPYGMVTAVSAGSAIITATANDGSGATGSRTLTVSPTPVEWISIRPSYMELTAGESMSLSCDVYPESATDRSVTWTSSDESVATVTADGTVTAVSAGSVIITATANDGSGVTAECHIKVYPAVVTSITLDRTEAELKVHETLKLTATTAPDNASDKTVYWGSTDYGIASVDGDGTVTATGPGEAVIIAMAASGVTAECHITVTAPPATSITLDPAEIQAMAGDCIQLTATVLPAEAASQRLEWTSSDESVATVTSDGMVSILTAGDATVTVSTTDGTMLSAECRITGLSGIDAILSDSDGTASVYTVGGTLLYMHATRQEISRLARGIYVINGRKVRL